MRYFKKALAFIGLVIGVSFVSYALINLLTQNLAESLLRLNNVPVITEAMIQKVSLELGLDKPFLVRYFIWLGSALRGDFGMSYAERIPVFTMILSVLPATLYLAGVALIIIIVSSILLGSLAATHQDSRLDRMIMRFVFITTAVPMYWSGLLFILIFSVKLRLFPTGGMQASTSVILPAVTLALAHMGFYIRMLRNTMIEEFHKPYVDYARYRGLSERSIRRQVMLNSLQTSIRALGMSIPKIVAGTILVENIFAWPGLGRLGMNAISGRDLPLIQGYILFSAVIYLCFNVMSSWIIKWLNPQLRGESYV